MTKRSKPETARPGAAVDAVAARSLSGDSVRTAVRTLDVFEIFAEMQAPMSLTELAGRLHAPLSSCHALVRTMQNRGYLYVLDERKRVYPTKRLLRIAQRIAVTDPILDRLASVLMALRDETGETVILGKRQGDAVTYLEVFESRQTIRYTSAPGDMKPLYSSAIGKAMLGSLSDAELARLLKKLAMPPVTNNTIRTVPELIVDIGKAKKRGIFVTRGENVADVMAIAISRAIGAEPYGVAVAGPIARIEPKYDTIVVALRKAGAAFELIDAELAGGARQGASS